MVRGLTLRRSRERLVSILTRSRHTASSTSSRAFDMLLINANSEAWRSRVEFRSNNLRSSSPSIPGGVGWGRGNTLTRSPQGLQQRLGRKRIESYGNMDRLRAEAAKRTRRCLCQPGRGRRAEKGQWRRRRLARGCLWHGEGIWHRRRIATTLIS